jgi:hypothetical protein
VNLFERTYLRLRAFFSAHPILSGVLFGALPFGIAFLVASHFHESWLAQRIAPTLMLIYAPFFFRFLWDLR